MPKGQGFPGSTKDSRVQGVYKASLNGTQAFDPYYYGYDGGMNNFMENGDTTISFYNTMSSPYPGNGGWMDFNKAFADGTFPVNQALSGEFKPVAVTAKTETSYDASGNAVTSGVTYTKWEIAYDSTTGYPTTLTETYMDASTDTATGKGVVTYTADSVHTAVNNYYQTERKNYYHDGSDFVLSSKTTRAKSGTWSPTAWDTTNTVTCYGSDGTTLSVDCYMENRAAKIVRTEVLSDTTGSETSEYYDASGDMFRREVTATTYDDVYLKHKATETYSEYESTTDTPLPLTYKVDYSYTDGQQTGRTRYTVTNGTATVLNTSTWTRDAQGRSIDFLMKDASGDATAHLVYTTADDGWVSSIRQYAYTANVQDTTPSCFWNSNYNLDYNYERDTAGNMTRTVIDYCASSYDASTDITTRTYVDTGSGKSVVVYNDMGLQTSYKGYSYTGTTPTLTSQTTYEYDSNGNRTKAQYYDVSGGTATAGYYMTYSYDTNLFQVSTKRYGSDGTLKDSNWADCTTGSACYSTTSYTYK